MATIPDRNVKRTAAIALLVALGAGAAPAGLAAQDRPSDAGWWTWAVGELLAGQEIRTRDGRAVVIEPAEKYERDRDEREGEDAGEGVPAFCRTGEGHPVFGRQWCLDKGFGLGSVTWRRGDRGEAEGFMFRRPPRGGERILDRPGVEEILGEEVLGTLLDAAAPDARNDPVTGRWLEPGEQGARVLQLRAGDRPLAELTDLDRDDAVDVVMWAEGVDGGPE